VKAVGTSLYILAGDENGSVVLKGSTNGSEPLQTLFTIYTSSPNTYPAFDADSSAIYYTDEFSVNRYFVDGEVGPSLLYPDHTPSPNFTRLQVFEGFVYFDDGNWIRSANTSTLDVEDLIPFEFSVSLSGNNHNGSGTCTCLDNFSGSDCTTCSGQVQWDNNVPSCVPILENGFPSSCSADYQCGNVPYTVCDDGECQCRSSFSGQLCTDCAGTVSWSSNVPECITSSQAPSSCTSVSITQSVRTSWTDDTSEFYLYDISILNLASQPIVSPVFFINSTNNVPIEIVQSWNLVLYANTVPTERLASLPPHIAIDPSSLYSASGYVTNGTLTTLTLLSC